MNFLTDSERLILLILKARISKALSFNNSSKLNEEERVELEIVFQEVDNLILYKGCSFKNVKDNFQKKLKDSMNVLKKSKKAYLKKHLIPLINKISMGNWESDKLDG